MRKLRIVRTPHEHDLMMDGPSLDIIVPEILGAVGAAGRIPAKDLKNGGCISHDD